MADNHLECIVKLGGRAVTHKEQFETANTTTIAVAAETFRGIDQEPGKYAVVHGAGSFGHFQAKEFGVAIGYSADRQSSTDIKKVQMGLCKTRLSVTKVTKEIVKPGANIELNHMIVSEFVKRGIPAVSMSPFNSWITEGKDVILHADIEVLRRSLHEGYLPVLHGDSAIDSTTGCCILGGDAIIEELCSHFNPRRVVFLTDVDGIYDRPPIQQGANHIPQIIVNQDGRIATTLSTSVSGHDVTGGIMGKIQSAARIVSQSQGRTKVYIAKLEAKVAKELVRDGSTTAGLMTEICYQS